MTIGESTSLITKLQLELEKAYDKINEYEYMITATPVNDKQLLTRELAHHIKKYEDLYNEANKPKESKQVKSEYSQTIILKNDKEINTELVLRNDCVIETEKIINKEKEIQVVAESTTIGVHVYPDSKHELTQTAKELENKESNLVKTETEIKFDITRIPEAAIITYNIIVE